MLRSTLLTLTLLVVVHATYYPWDNTNRWPVVTERSGEDAYPGLNLGEGTAVWHGGAVEMCCTLNKFQGQVVSNVVWTKLKGAYEEPFYPCPHCYYMDDRIRAYDRMGKSILIIREPGPMDQGVYRCTATAEYPDGRLITIYQVVQLQ